MAAPIIWVRKAADIRGRDQASIDGAGADNLHPSRRLRACCVAVALLLVLMVRERATATPVFAQACSTQLPAFDAFNAAGREHLQNVDIGVDTYGPDDVGGRAVTNFKDVRDKTPLQSARLVSAEQLPQRRLVWTGLAKPYEVGAFPSIGEDRSTGSASFGCEHAAAENSSAGYLSPRVDSSPIQPAGSAPSHWKIGSARQLVGHERGPITFTYYQTNQGLGGIGSTRLIPPTGVQTSGGPGFSYAIDPYTRFSTTISLQNQRPALSIFMRFKPPVWSHLK